MNQNSNHPNWMIISSFLVGLLISVFSPEDVLENKIAFAIYYLAEKIFPSVASIKGGYDREQIVKLYFSCVWFSSPLVFLATYKIMLQQAAAMFEKWGRNKTVLTIFVGIFFPLASVVLFFINPEGANPGDVRTWLITQSKLGLPLWGFVVPSGAAALLAVTAFWLKNIERTFN